MAQQITLKATSGRKTGSAATRRLRRDGLIPGIVYGLEDEPVLVSVKYGEARTALSGPAGLNALLNLEVDGGNQLCLLKDIQRHVVRDEVTHIDFIRVDANVAIEAEVPVVLTGEAREVTQANGMIDQTLFALLVSTKPTNIPNEFVVDISEMEVGDTIRVEDIEMPEGVESLMEGELDICSAMITRSTLEALEEEEEAEEAAEAAAEAAEEAAEESDSDD